MAFLYNELVSRYNKLASRHYELASLGFSFERIGFALLRVCFSLRLKQASRLLFAKAFGLNMFISFYNYTSIQTFMMIIQAMGLERKLKAYKVLLPFKSSSPFSLAEAFVRK